MPFEVRPIKFLYSTCVRELAEGRGELAPIALENLQARLRGLTLMTLSNHYNALVFTTGNKSELATGYGTLYGDMCGALGPIGDLFKTRVYELARHLNVTHGGPIPERSITKAPSAELRPNQTDQDTLPPYDLLDALLEDYLEKASPLAELEKKYSSAAGAKDPKWVRETLRRVEINEFKRRQAAPVLKVSHKAFGIGRRIPIAKVWDQ
jgi:NAD+ synthetase